MHRFHIKSNWNKWSRYSKIYLRQLWGNVFIQYTHLSQVWMTSIQASSAGCARTMCASVCVHAVCGIWCLGLSGWRESYERSLCNWNVMRTGEEFDWAEAFSHAPTSRGQMSNSFPNEKWHSPNPFLLIRPPPPSSVTPSQLLHSPTLWFLPAYLQSSSD